MANHYILDGGSGDGSSWSSAWDDLPANFTRGDTYYIADGSYGGHTFDDPVVGNQVITIKKATESDHGTDTGWSSAYGDGQAVFSGGFTFDTAYWTLDGQTRGSDWKSDYGFKQVTGQTKGIRIDQEYITHITIRYLEMEGTFTEASPSNDLFYQSAYNDSDITFQYCYLHDAGRCPFLIRALDRLIIEYCYIYKNLSTGTQHAEGISASDRGGIGNDNCIIRWNIWESTDGTGFIVFRGDGWEIYGNLFFNCDGNNGGITTWSTDPDQPSVTNAKVYNNTIVDCTGSNQGTRFAMTGASPSGNVHYNNLFYSCENYSHNGCTSDYNAHDDEQSESHEQVLVADPFENYASDDFHLSAHTDSGTDLGSPYDEDMDGVTRSNWDRGAYEYDDGGSEPPAANSAKLVMILS